MRAILILLLCACIASACSGPFEDATQSLADRLKNRIKSAIPPAPTVPSTPAPTPAPAPAPSASQPNAPAPAATAPAQVAERMSEEEKVYVAPQATARVADGPRKMFLDPKYGSKFSSAASYHGEVTITNPFMDPAKIVLVKSLALQCTADNGLIVGARAGLDKELKALGTGYWRIAADGAITPLHTRSTNAYITGGGAKCDARYGKTILTPEHFALAPDGSLVTTTDYVIERIQTDGFVSRVAGAPSACEESGNASQVRGLVDGPADIARFNKVGSPAVDPQGNIWVPDQDECALRRISPDGQVTTVIPPEKVCATTIQPEDKVALRNLTWDAVHGELVGGRDFPVARPVHTLYTTVFRIKPNGEFRRVLFGKKGGASPAKVQLDGIDSIAVDPQGRIHYGGRIMTNNSVFMVLRVDEAGATVVPVTGGGFKAGDSIEFKPRDGAAARAYFNHLDGMCFTPDGSLFVLDEHLVRRLANAQVSTWAF
ncbi:MAG: hypothetical protein ABI665_01910 [Vicinamibacterales bacterium]